MDGHDRMLTAFLAGDLEPAQARRWDEHLLGCEGCWRAVREDRVGRQAAGLLRQPVPPGLADRVAFAVEVAATASAAGRRAGPDARTARRARPTRRVRWQQRAGAGALGLAITLLLFLLAGGRETPNVPAAVTAVARYAQALPSQEHARSSTGTVPVAVGRPLTVTVSGQRIVMRTWRLGSAEAVVAVSGQPFPMPAGAQAASGGGMAWSARLGKLTLYCLNGPTSELVAAAVPAPELAELVARLPPA